MAAAIAAYSIYQWHRNEAEAVGITLDLGEAHALAAAWLDPVLDLTARGTWDHKRAVWSGET